MKNKIILGLIIFSLFVVPFVLGTPECGCNSANDCGSNEFCYSTTCIPVEVGGTDTMYSTGICMSNQYNPGHTCENIYMENCGRITTSGEITSSMNKPDTSAIEGVNTGAGTYSKGLSGIGGYCGVYGSGTQGVHGIGNIGVYGESTVEGNTGYGLKTPDSAWIGGNLRTGQYCGFSGSCYSINELVGGGGTSVWTQTVTNDIYYNNGNVGIGTNEPEEKLEVDGNVEITGKYYGDGSDLAGVTHAPILWDPETGNVFVIIGPGEGLPVNP